MSRLLVIDGLLKRRPRVGAAALAIALPALAACSAKDVVATDTSGYVADASQRVAAADWSQAETVEIALSEYKYVPDRLHFQQGRPYRLHLVNTGFEAHDFTSPAFFKAVAVRQLVSKGSASTAPALQSIGLGRGEAKDLEFVPVTPGTYPVECDEPLHSLFGMKGVATID